MCSHSYCRGVHNLRVCCSCFPLSKERRERGVTLKDAPNQSWRTGLKGKDQEVLNIFTTFVYAGGPVAVQNQDDKRGSSHEVVLQLSVIISHPLPSQILRCTNEASIEKSFKTPTVRWLQRHGHHCGKSKSPLSTR